MLGAAPTQGDVNKSENLLLPTSIQNTLHPRNSLIYRTFHTPPFTLKRVAYTRTIIYAHYNKYFNATSSGAAVDVAQRVNAAGTTVFSTKVDYI